MKRKRSRTLEEVQGEWYGKLKAKGFQDIEDTTDPGRPLKEWHSRKFTTERSRARQADRERYDRMLDNFLNSQSINEICRLITRHGNNPLRPQDVRQIIEMHRAGLTERAIAEKLKCGKKSVHSTIEKARTWMKLVS